MQFYRQLVPQGAFRSGTRRILRPIVAPRPWETIRSKRPVAWKKPWTVRIRSRNGSCPGEHRSGTERCRSWRHGRLHPSTVAIVIGTVSHTCPSVCWFPLLFYFRMRSSWSCHAFSPSFWVDRDRSAFRFLVQKGSTSFLPSWILAVGSEWDPRVPSLLPLPLLPFLSP